MKSVVHSLTAGFAAVALAGCGPKSSSPTPPAPCVNSGDICTVAGEGTQGFFGDGKPAWQAYLSYPMDIAIGPDKLMYVVDWNNHRIRRIAADGVITSIAGNGELGDTTGLEDAQSFNHPTGIVFDSAGNALIAAWHNSRIKKLDPAGNLANICGTGKRWYSGDGATAAKADLDLPSSLAIDASGNIIFMDQANQIIRKIDATGGITRIAGQCILGKSSGETDTVIDCPVAMGAQANQKQVWSSALAANPMLCTIYYACGAAFAGDGAQAINARLGQPVGQAATPGGHLLIDPAGNIIFADSSNNRIRKIDTAGIITTIAGNGPGAYSAADEGKPATSVSLNFPVDVDRDTEGNIYFSDVKNNCIRKISTQGNVTTVAGKCGPTTFGFSGDGAAATGAQLDNPYGIFVDSTGDLFIADTQNNVIRKVKK